MKIKFYKYQATGNDFIIIDAREENLVLEKKDIQFLCDRHFGIGSDGLIIFGNSDKADFSMQFFNPDGSGGMMCGNGGRSIVKFASDKGVISDSCSFIAPDGLHFATINNDIISLKMVNPTLLQRFEDGYYINTGTSHFVVFEEDLNKINIIEKGRSIRYDERFSHYNGCNVNFVEEISLNNIRIRTYERGVEDETLACGTGICAAALTYSIEKGLKNGKRTINISAKGGDLQVEFEKKSDNSLSEVYLIGTANSVFEGEIEISKKKFDKSKKKNVNLQS
ncbi:MAG: diaminopimelate epimerase [Bacteroidales bacterium]|nr:diaminopimelate epimerase [Bacteroidales bacterium]